MNPFSLSEIFKQTLINFFQKFLTNILSQLLQTYYSRKFRQWHSILLTTSILRLSSIVGWNWAGWLQGVSRRLLLSGQLYYLHRNCLSLRSLLSQRHDLWPWISLSPRDVQLSPRSTRCRLMRAVYSRLVSGRGLCSLEGREELYNHNDKLCWSMFTKN